MDEYVESLQEIKVQEDRSYEELTRDELKVSRKYVDNLNWLAANMKPDILIYTLELAKKQNKATLKDFKEVNRILKKIHEKDSKLMFKRIGDNKEMCIIGICDSSYHVITSLWLERLLC